MTGIFSSAEDAEAAMQPGWCVLQDGVPMIMSEFEKAYVIISVPPSCRAAIPGQFKALIDRCRPWCSAHEPHAQDSAWKAGLYGRPADRPGNEGMHPDY